MKRVRSQNVSVRMIIITYEISMRYLNTTLTFPPVNISSVYTLCRQRVTVTKWVELTKAVLESILTPEAEWGITGLLHQSAQNGYQSFYGRFGFPFNSGANQIYSGDDSVRES